MEDDVILFVLLCVFTTSCCLAAMLDHFGRTDKEKRDAEDNIADYVRRNPLDSGDMGYE